MKISIKTTTAILAIASSFVVNAGAQKVDQGGYFDRWQYTQGPQPLPQDGHDIICDPYAATCSTSQHSLLVLPNQQLFAATDADTGFSPRYIGGAFVLKHTGWKDRTGTGFNANGSSDVAQKNGLVFLAVKINGNVAGDGGIYFADDHHWKWKNIFLKGSIAPLNNTNMRAIDAVSHDDKTQLYAGTSYSTTQTSGVFQTSYHKSSTPNPSVWKNVLPGSHPGNIYVRDIYSQDGYVYVGTETVSPTTGTVWRAKVGSENWKRSTNLALGNAEGVRSITGACDKLFAGTYSDNVPNTNGDVLKSRDNGRTWSSITDGDSLMKGKDIFVLAVAKKHHHEASDAGCDYTLYAGTRDDGVFQWTEKHGWRAYSDDLPANNRAVRSLVVKPWLLGEGYTLYAGLSRGAVWKAEHKY
jgi:hypothetical protein